MGFDEPGTSKTDGDRIDWRSRQFDGHVLIIKPIAHLSGIKTPYDDNADPVKVWVVDLNDTAEDGSPGKVYRNVLIFQKPLIGAWKGAVATGTELLGHVYHGKLPPPSPYSGFQFASLTGSAPTVEAAQMWLQANPWFLKEAGVERDKELGRGSFGTGAGTSSPAPAVPATPAVPAPSVPAPAAPQVSAPAAEPTVPDTQGVLERLRRQAEANAAAQANRPQSAPPAPDPYAQEAPF